MWALQPMSDERPASVSVVRASPGAKMAPLGRDKGAWWRLIAPT